MNYSYLIGFIFIVSLHSQEVPAIGSALPIWIPADTTVLFPDTLDLNYQKKSLILNQKILFAGIGVVVVAGAAAWQFHSQAEIAYKNYRTEGDLSLIKKHYDKAAKFDRYTGTSYLGIQIGFLIILRALFP